MQQVFVAVLDIHIGVAGDPEGIPFDDLHPGKQGWQKRRDEFLGRQEANGFVVAVGGVEADEPVDVVGHLHPGEVLAAVVGSADGDGQVLPRQQGLEHVAVVRLPSADPDGESVGSPLGALPGVELVQVPRLRNIWPNTAISIAVERAPPLA